MRWLLSTTSSRLQPAMRPAFAGRRSASWSSTLRPAFRPFAATARSYCRSSTIWSAMRFATAACRDRLAGDRLLFSGLGANDFAQRFAELLESIGLLEPRPALPFRGDLPVRISARQQERDRSGFQQVAQAEHSLSANVD